MLSAALGIKVGSFLLVAVASAVATYFTTKKPAASTPATPTAPVQTTGSPVLQHLMQGFAAQLQAQGHAVLDGLIAKVIPTAAPIVAPLANAVVDKLETKIANGQTAQPLDLSTLTSQLEGLIAKIKGS